MKHLLITFLLLFSFSAFAILEMPRTDYELIAASQTNQVIGQVGGAGDILERLIIVPETTGAGTVTIRDGTGGVHTSVLVTGTLADLSPQIVYLGARSSGGAWYITTGANVHVIAVGRFK